MKKMVLIPYDQYLNSAETKDEHSFPQTEVKENCLDRDLILQPFGKNQRKLAETLLSYVEKNISWNDKGEIVINDIPVVGSHITDLIKDALFNYKNFEPCGVSEFYSHLKNVPSTLIKNINRKPLIGKGVESSSQISQLPNKDYSSQLPPPGLPTDKVEIDLSKRKKRKKEIETDWIKLWESL